MAGSFVRHLSNANAHLQAATHALAVGDREEAVVCLRCYLMEIESARRLPCSQRHGDLLAELSAAALTGEALIEAKPAQPPEF